MNDTRRKVLVVDDEPVIRLFLQELFEDEGYEVVGTQSIAEGLAALREQEFDLVVTDKNLPDGTGFEIVHAAKALEPPCEAMIITGYASLDSAVMALQIGAYDYVLKPIEDVDMLLEKARKAIEKKDLARELLELRTRVASMREAQPARTPSSNPGACVNELAGDLPQLMKLAELGSLLPMLTHELRQPLTGITGHVDLLLHSRELDTACRRKLESIRGQLSHVHELVESLTSYSRFARGRGLVSIESTVERALTIFPGLRSSSRYQLELDIEPGLPPLRGNANSLQQVLVNLIKNAKDALDEVNGGALRLRARRESEDWLVLTVEDAGPGISEDVRDQMFQPFFTTKPEGLGTGLGLTICRQIVEEHGGRLFLSSATTGGTRVELHIPTAPVAAPVGAG